MGYVIVYFQVKTADNRIIQEQLSQKICEIQGLHQTVASLKQQLQDAEESRNISPLESCSLRYSQLKKGLRLQPQVDREIKPSKDAGLHLQAQATEIEELREKLTELTESKEQLESRNQKLADESTYAKGLASAAAVELKALSEEVAKLMNQNERLTAELVAMKNSPANRRASSTLRNGRRETNIRRQEQSSSQSDLLKRELAMSKERELQYEAALMEKDQQEAELQSKVEESKQREAYLENELANMWVLVAKLKKSHGEETESAT